MAALFRYEQTPYLIRRRCESTAASRAALIEMISAAAAEIDLRRSLLELDAPIVGLAYNLLIGKTAPAVQQYRVLSWQAAPISRDEDIPGTAFDIAYDNKVERDLCLQLMHGELRMLSLLNRRSMQRKLDAASKKGTGVAETSSAEDVHPPI